MQPKKTSPQHKSDSVAREVRPDAVQALLAGTADQIDAIVTAGEPVRRAARAEARLAAAHAVHECRAVIADLLEASGASAHFVTNPPQPAKRDVDIVSGHVVFDYDVSRELAGATSFGSKISPITMI